MAVIWNMSDKKCILWARDIKSLLFLIIIISASWICNLFWVSCLSNKWLLYQWVASILRQFWIILSPNKEWGKIFFFSCPRHCDRGLIVDIEFCFQIWNKKEDNIISSRVISSHIGLMYSGTPWSCKIEVSHQICLSSILLMVFPLGLQLFCF